MLGSLRSNIPNTLSTIVRRSPSRPQAWAGVEFSGTRVDKREATHPTVMGPICPLRLTWCLSDSKNGTRLELKMLHWVTSSLGVPTGELRVPLVFFVPWSYWHAPCGIRATRGLQERDIFSYSSLTTRCFFPKHHAENQNIPSLDDQAVTPELIRAVNGAVRWAVVRHAVTGLWSRHDTNDKNLRCAAARDETPSKRRRLSTFCWFIACFRKTHF